MERDRKGGNDAVTGYGAVILTGGSSGIGRAFLKSIGSMAPNCLVCNLSRTIPEGIEGDRWVHFGCDLSNRQAVEEVVPEVLALIRLRAPQGGLMLINNSGFGAYGVFPEPGLEHCLEMVSVNMEAPVHLTARFLPEMLARGGTVIQIASTASFQPTPFLGLYGATKSFLLHWSLSLREELRGTGVHVLCVCPGPTETNFFRRAGFRERTGLPGQTPEEVVEATWGALRRKRSLVVSGWLNRVLVSLSGLLPKRAQARAAGMVLSRVRRNRQRGDEPPRRL